MRIFSARRSFLASAFPRYSHKRPFFWALPLDRLAQLQPLPPKNHDIYPEAFLFCLFRFFFSHVRIFKLFNVRGVESQSLELTTEYFSARRTPTPHQTHVSGPQRAQISIARHVWQPFAQPPVHWRPDYRKPPFCTRTLGQAKQQSLRNTAAPNQEHIQSSWDSGSSSLCPLPMTT